MIELHSTLAGDTHWQHMDAAGNILAENERHNLILNSGLDAFAGEKGYVYGVPNNAFHVWRSVAQIGTGSVAPDPAQSTLESPAMTTGISVESVTHTVEGAELVIRSKIKAQFDITEARNLTEYGFGPSGQTMSIRELFRDAQGAPVVLSVQPGQSLRLVHTLTVRLPYSFRAASVAVDNAGTVSQVAAKYSMWRYSTNYALHDICMMFAPAEQAEVYRFAVAMPDAVESVPYVPPSGQRQTNVLAYVPGSYRRIKRAVFPVDGVNGDHFGYSIGNEGYGLKFQSANGQPLFSVVSGQTVTVDVALTWGRA